MSSDNAAIVKGIYEALAAGDLPRALGAMSPDIVWIEADNFPYADNNPHVGHEAVATGIFQRCAGDWDDFAVHMGDLLADGDRVVAFGRYAGSYKGTGRAMNPQAVHLWTLRDGKAVAFQQYIDTLDVARAMGTAPG